jgi:hypothetical protein
MYYQQMFPLEKKENQITNCKPQLAFTIGLFQQLEMLIAVCTRQLSLGAES